MKEHIIYVANVTGTAWGALFNLPTLQKYNTRLTAFQQKSMKMLLKLLTHWLERFKEKRTLKPCVKDFCLIRLFDCFFGNEGRNQVAT